MWSRESERHGYGGKARLRTKCILFPNDGFKITREFNPESRIVPQARVIALSTCNSRRLHSLSRRTCTYAAFLYSLTLSGLTLWTANNTVKGTELGAFHVRHDALSMPWRYLPRATMRECCWISRSPTSLASFEPCRMDCARTADTVSARDLARDEAATCTEMARRALGIARRGTLKTK
jgi:hypothetical protein